MVDYKNIFSRIKDTVAIEDYLQEILDEAYKENIVPKQKDGTENLNGNSEDLICFMQNMQNTIMPYENLLPEMFVQSFAYSLPKERVSGDFCWVEQFEDKIYIAAVDCNMHGVMGAMTGMISANILNRVLYEFNFTDTGKMLDKVKELMSQIFKDSKFDKNYGLKISLCCINKYTCVLEWSGANNNLFYVHNGIMEEMIADKHMIGNDNNSLLFTKHKMYLSKGDMIYLFTDGFANQAGGEDGDRLNCRCFQDALKKIAPLEAKNQLVILQKKFDDWKGEREQTDDVLVIGIRL